jgi:hypothetical protein
VPWAKFRPWYSRRFDAGNHVFVVGPTRSGKTVLLAQFPVIKPKWNWLLLDAKGGDDPELDWPTFEMIRRWPPPDGFPDLFDDERLLTRLRRMFKLEPEPEPPPDKPKHYRLAPAVPSLASITDQRATFSAALEEAFGLKHGQAYSLVIDEGQRIMAEKRASGMGLGESLIPFFQMKAVHHSSVVFSTQWPVYVPKAAHAETRHRFVFKLYNDDRVEDAAAMLGSKEMRPIIKGLGRHEFLYQDSWYDRWAISKVGL